MNIESLQRLYPSLNFASFATNRPTPTLNINPSYSQDLNKNTKVFEESIPKPSKESLTPPIKEPIQEQIQEPIKEPIKEPVEEHILQSVDETLTKKGKPKDPELQTDQPNKKIIYPKKGEQGIQKRYSDADRKDQYLKRLSKLSIRKAEEKMSKVEEILVSKGHDKTALKQEERELKKKLKLINEAYLFGNDTIPTKLLDDEAENKEE